MGEDDGDNEVQKRSGRRAAYSNAAEYGGLT